MLCDHHDDRIELSQVIAYVGIVVIVYAVGFMLYMLFEAPFAAVFHILYDRNFR